MKKFKILGLSALALAGVTMASLASCSSGTGYEIFGVNRLGLLSKYGKCDITFKEDNKNIPYISLEDGVKLMSMIRSANLDDKNCKFTLTKQNDDYVISNETGAKCVVSGANQTLVFDEYDKLTNVVPASQKPLALMNLKNHKSITTVESEYTPGKSVTVDLKPYSKLDIYVKDGNYYIPLSVYNSVLFNTYENISLAFNGKNLFFIPGESLSVEDETSISPTALGEKFRDGAPTSYNSDYAEYFYQSVCLDFDTNYGLKEKFTSFDKWITDSGWKDKLTSTDPRVVDNYTNIALSWLNDAHTALSEGSNMYKFRDVQFDMNSYNPVKSNWHDSGERYAKAKKQAGIVDGLQYKDDTVFVTFSSFNNINEGALYNKTIEKDDDDFTGADDNPGLDFGQSGGQINTAVLFNQLYTDLTTTSKKDTIKNIVVDVSANDGGAADALVYGLSTLIGNVYFDMVNPLSGARNHQTFKADMNADGKIDDKDKGLIDQGFKVYFLSA